MQFKERELTVFVASLCSMLQHALVRECKKESLKICYPKIESGSNLD